LRLSKEEADLAEALRRSAVAESSSSRNPPSSSRTNTLLIPRRGYGVSQGGKDEDRDVAAAAFRSAVFGETRDARLNMRLNTDTARERARQRDLDDRLISDADETSEMAQIALALERSAAESRASSSREALQREALEREALQHVWAEAAAAAERKAARERFAAAADDAAARERRREARREAERLERDAARRERKRAAEADAEAARLENARKAAESEAASSRVAREIGRLDLPSALAAVGFAPSDDASPAAVRKAYKRAALRFHPDRTRSLSVAERARGEEVWKALGSKMEAFERTVA
jgi:vacuolar-type H+-ATPase subunit I/STV1